MSTIERVISWWKDREHRDEHTAGDERIGKRLSGRISWWRDREHRDEHTAGDERIGKR